MRWEEENWVTKIVVDVYEEALERVEVSSFEL
jgi:hypothetical protein